MRLTHTLALAVLCCTAASCRAVPQTPVAGQPVAGVQTKAQPMAEGAAAKIAIDAPVAAFSLPDMSGQSVTVGDWNADGRKATVLIFTSVQCPVSRGYEKRINAIANEFGGKGVRVIGINSNKAEAPDRIAAHNKQSSINFPVLKDQGNVIADRFNARVTPEVYLIDSEGILRYHGRVDDNLEEADVTTHDLHDNLTALLAGKPIVNKEVPAFGCSIKRVGA